MAEGLEHMIFNIPSKPFYDIEEFWDYFLIFQFHICNKINIKHLLFI